MDFVLLYLIKKLLVGNHGQGIFSYIRHDSLVVLDSIGLSSTPAVNLAILIGTFTLCFSPLIRSIYVLIIC